MSTAADFAFVPADFQLDPSPWVGRYATRVTIWTPPSSGIETLVAGNSSRVYLAFQRTATGIITINPGPFALADPGAFFLHDVELLQFHWSTHRTLVTGAWYASGGSAASIVITEVYALPAACGLIVQGE